MLPFANLSVFPEGRKEILPQNCPEKEGKRSMFQRCINALFFPINALPLLHKHNTLERMADLHQQSLLALSDPYEGVMNKLHPGKGIVVVATRNYQPGELVHTATVVKETSVRDRWTIQIGRNLHVIVRQPGRLFSHSCNPNMYIRVADDNKAIEFYALRNISEDEELTWNYCSAEDVFSCPFECLCGTETCEGLVRGFLYCTPAKFCLKPQQVTTYIAQRWEDMGTKDGL
jgi:hypothetical protein